MKTSELIKFVKSFGCRIERHGSKHDEWVNPKTGGRTYIPRHKSDEIPTGTVHRILKDLGLK